MASLLCLERLLGRIDFLTVVLVVRYLGLLLLAIVVVAKVVIELAQGGQLLLYLPEIGSLTECCHQVFSEYTFPRLYLLQVLQHKLSL
jgi:hypothetical protein